MKKYSDTGFLAIIISAYFLQLCPKAGTASEVYSKTPTHPLENSISSHPEEGFNLLYVALKEVIYDSPF